MPGDADGGTKVRVQGGPPAIHDEAALAALCAAVDRAVQAYRPEGLSVREVVVTLEVSVPAFGSDAAPVYVDVYDSGYGHGI
jgi:hypothetical protein